MKKYQLGEFEAVVHTVGILDDEVYGAAIKRIETLKAVEKQALYIKRLPALRWCAILHA